MENSKKSLLITAVTVLVTVSILFAVKAVDITVESEKIQAVTLTTEKQTQTDLINLNTASFDELKNLREIGEIRARAIIDYREQHGGFRSVDQLLEIDGIGEYAVEINRDILTV